jgi:hypothetical protein
MAGKRAREWNQRRLESGKTEGKRVIGELARKW